jgi:hypothetical protein
MALKKDKAKVLDEVWTLDRVTEFLVVQPAERVEPDFGFPSLRPPTQGKL